MIKSTTLLASMWSILLIKMVIAWKEFLGHKITATSHLPAGQIAMSRHSVGHKVTYYKFLEKTQLLLRKQNLEVIAKRIDSEQLFDSHFVSICLTICKACMSPTWQINLELNLWYVLGRKIITMKFDENFRSTTLQYVMNVKLNHAKVLALPWEGALWKTFHICRFRILTVTHHIKVVGV